MSQQTHFKIVVMEDSEVYNALLTQKLKLYTESLSLDRNCEINVVSYIQLSEFIKNMTEDIDLLFLDYYLAKNITASDIIPKIKEVCKNCTIVIISRTYDVERVSNLIEDGVAEFIFKDHTAMDKACFIVKKTIFDRLEISAQQE